VGSSRAIQHFICAFKMVENGNFGGQVFVVIAGLTQFHLREEGSHQCIGFVFI